jgi:putative transposase
MNRTFVIHLQPTSEQAGILHQTLEQYTACYNAVACEGFMTQCSNGVELHKRTYYPLRARYPALPAQLVCAARVKATESVKSALTRRKNYDKHYPMRVAKAQKDNKPIPTYKPAKVPQSTLCAIRYDARSYWVKWENRTASIATIAGRVQLSFTIPQYALPYLAGKQCSADLCYRKGRYSLHIVVTLPEPLVENNNEVIGIDLGLNRPAVTSNRHFLGERRWKDHDHVLSKRVVQHATHGSTIVLENLTNIRERVTHRKGEGQRRKHSWSFAQLFGFIHYNAKAREIEVTRIDPRHTSQTCSRCGYQARNNRRSQSLFLCRKCGYQLNADLNAAQNIREKYLASLADFGISLVGGPPVKRPLVSTLCSEGQAPEFTHWVT